jgi:hypothetical protein
MQSRVEESGLRERKGPDSPPARQPARTLAQGARLGRRGAAPRHWQTLAGSSVASPLPLCLLLLSCPCPCTSAPAPLSLPPTPLRAEPGDKDWIDNAVFTSVEFVGEREAQSQRFGSTALGAGRQAAPCTSLSLSFFFPFSLSRDHVDCVTNSALHPYSCRPSATVDRQHNKKNNFWPIPSPKHFKEKKKKKKKNTEEKP